MKKVLILGNVFPEPTSSAAGTKMMQWLELFQAINAQVIYASTSPKNDFSANLGSFVEDTWQIEINNSSFNKQLRQFQPDIVLYDRFMVEEQFSWRIREEFPDAIHLLETQDLHFLRETRQKQTHFFNTTCKREIASILRCDKSFVISTFEMDFLRDNFPFTQNKIAYYPLCYEVAPNFILEKDRKDFCFIGNFLHAPNRQAVLFLKSIWREVRKKTISTTVHIYGAYPNQQIMQLHSVKDGFLVHGRAASVSEIFKKHKFLVAPILFGAGLKGKLLEAMQHGIVSLTTPVGAEGIAKHEDWNGKIVALPDFVQTIVNLEKLENYEELQTKGREILTRFSPKEFTPRIAKQLDSLVKNKQTDYLSEILNFHRQQSIRYLSKWIAAKNEQK